jgi:hypothetical protein
VRRWRHCGRHRPRPEAVVPPPAPPAACCPRAPCARNGDCTLARAPAPAGSFVPAGANCSANATPGALVAGWNFDASSRCPPLALWPAPPPLAGRGLHHRCGELLLGRHSAAGHWVDQRRVADYLGSPPPRWATPPSASPLVFFPRLR